MRKTEKKEKTLNAKLFVRFLPGADFDYDSIKIESNKKVLYVKCLQDLAKGDKVKIPNYWCFCTDGIFWNACQSEVYNEITSGLYEELFDGISATIISFGQTGAGKTTTTSGLRYQYQNRGLILRILSQLFDEIEARSDIFKISLGMSYLEFMGQSVKDLIVNQHLDNVKDAMEHSILGEFWAWEQIFEAEMRKSFAETAPYKGSNRGHSVLTFHLHLESLVDTDPVILHSKIHVVDMGGIDNYGNKVSEWKHKLDVGDANLSKSLMEQLILCLNGTVWKNENHVCPYKSSKFLLYLHDTLNPKCLLKFVAHIYGNKENLSLTISALKFGDRLRALKPTKLEKSFEPNCALEMSNFEKEFLQLKDEIELAGMFKDSPDYSKISQERYQEIRRAAEAYLFGQLGELTLFSLGQARLTLEAFRDLFQKFDTEKDQLVKDAVATATELLQAQFAMEKAPSSALSVLPTTQKMSKRKTHQQESQISYGSTFRSSDSSQNVLGRASSVVQQAGMTDRRGIGIGLGKNFGNFEGNVTRAFKKLKSRKSDSIVVKGVKSTAIKDVGNPVSKNQIADEIDILPIEVPTREIVWQQFITENAEEANELRSNIENCEAQALEAKKKYMTALGDLSKLRTEIEEWKYELENCHHIRQIYDKEEFGEETNYTATESEKNFIGIIAQREEQVNVFIEYCHVALIDLRNAVEELKEAKKSLEQAFQDFSKERYKIILPSDEPCSEMKWEDFGREELFEGDVRKQAQLDLYCRLNQKLLNYVPKEPKYPRRPWVTLF